jgi:hypothetical protein
MLAQVFIFRILRAFATPHKHSALAVRIGVIHHEDKTVVKH